MAHTPVMLDEVLAALKPADGEVYVDGTFGAGGYSRAILRAAQCKVYAIDRDPSTENFARKLEQEFPGRFVWIVGNFSDMCRLLSMHGVKKVDGIVFDLGVSSMQLDQVDRGFSFRNDGPLDMRMGCDGMTAADLVNTASEEEIADILYTYGEEQASRRIARAIVNARTTQRITRTAELAALVAATIGRHGDKDPATRTFQALRIHINDELGEITKALEAAEQMLKPGGRLVVVTFHSLEDRLVKRFTHSRCGKLAGASRHVPETAGEAELPHFFMPRPEKVKASGEEARRNPRARSATLRSITRREEDA